MRTNAAQTLFSFYRASGIVHAQLTRRAEAVLPLGLTMPQFMVIDHLRQAEEKVAPIDLAAQFHLTKGAITNLLGQLQRKGLIEITGNPQDGRSKLVLLNESGSGAHRKCLLALSEFTSLLLGEFDSGDLASALPVMARFSSWLEQE